MGFKQSHALEQALLSIFFGMSVGREDQLAAIFIIKVLYSMCMISSSDLWTFSPCQCICVV